MTATAPLEPRENHHALRLHELLLILGTDRHAGLTEEEARRRLARFGPNQLPGPRRGGPWLRLRRQLNNPLVYVLLAAGTLTLVLAEYVDSAVIFGVVVVNTVLGYVQEAKAEAALDSLRSMVHTRARVRRERRERHVDSEELVPGDVVLLDPGDKVPADLRVVTGTDLRADESALTGESLPVSKGEVVLPEATPVADRSNMLYAGTLVAAGQGAGIVVATGSDTEIGAIHRFVGAAEALATPLTRKLTWFSKVLTVAILALAALTFAIGVARGERAVDMFTAAVALAVGAIPEGLPAAVTITLAIGVVRMARHRAVVRRLPAVETLGGATVICTDKTGTLTRNQMTVRELWTPAGPLTFTGSGYGTAGEALDPSGRPVAAADLDAAQRWALLAAANCNDARLTPAGGIVGDPTEAALLVAAGKAGVPAYGLCREAALPFSSARLYMATRHPAPEAGGDGPVVLVKGALERVLDLCGSQVGADGTLVRLDRDRVTEAAEALAEQGMRVLATAVGPAAGDGLEAADLPGSVAFTGLLAMLDPPREAASDAVRTCRTAGIAVKMITGDHRATAAAIARRIGLLDGPEDGRLLTGEQLDRLDAAALPEAVDRASVFARVSPEQKLRLVEALQARGHVVAMTGDGVNDAPALKQADIGIAMGRTGTEVAKDAGDMVLTDDDFATIEAAVEEGRGVFDNLVKFLVWTLPTNMGEAAVILVAILLGSALPILPTQILWINMTTAVALGLMLAWEPKEPGIMVRPPRDPAQSLLTPALVFRTLLVCAVLVAGSWWIFHHELSSGASVPESRTAAMNVFVAVELFYLFSCRSLVRPVWRLGLFSNRWLLVGVSVQLLGQVAITYLPAMNLLFHTAPLSPATWGRVLLVAVLASVVVAVDKRRARHLI